MLVVAAPDKFRGTATARDVAAAIASAAANVGAEATQVPMADGGEGTLDALGGANRTTTVTGPLGDPVDARWRYTGRTAIVEMATASGLALVGGTDGNDPVAASTYGTGELISAALDAGSERVVVGVGGSATTDGGLGALRALYPLARLKRCDLEVACDVRTTFVQAAASFAPQKGATPAQVRLLERRLERLAQVYENDYGVDVRSVEGGGAAGGLAGGLTACGAVLVAGFDLIADEVGLLEALEVADLVVTGEGFLDEQSFEGKVVGGVATMAAEVGVPVLAVAGQVYDGVGDRVPTVALTERFGADRAHSDPLACVEEVVTEHLRAL